MKQAYPEGTWFAVPLRTGGFAVGIIARLKKMRGGKMILGYFFGKVWAQPPPLEEVIGCRPEEAVHVGRVGDLGLFDGSWPVLGSDPKWRREDWPVPLFIRREDLTERVWLIQRSDHDISKIESETRINPTTTLQEDCLDGAGSLEIYLTKLIRERAH